MIFLSFFILKQKFKALKLIKKFLLKSDLFFKTVLIYKILLIMLNKIIAQRNLTELARENTTLKTKIIELQAESEQRQLNHKQIKKQLNDLHTFTSQIQQTFDEHKQQSQKISQKLIKQMDQKNAQISILKAQLTAQEQSHQNLTDVVKDLNGKVKDLMRQISNKNRFIKEYLEKNVDQ